jgi:copper homeostasis protein
MPFDVVLEVCVDSVASAIAAREGGASRVELCESLVDGGVTPSFGKIQAVVAAARPLPVHVLVRPRAGDFLYSAAELEVMRLDVAAAAAAGAAGVVTGVLRADGRVDTAATAALFRAAKAAGLACVFHRAVDAAADFGAAVADAAAAGADAILTSGGAPSALAGAADIARAGALTMGRVEIIAGGGITADNAADVVRLARVASVHGSCRAAAFIDGGMRFRKDPPIYMGSARALEPALEYGRREASPESVAAVCRALGGAARAERESVAHATDAGDRKYAEKT